MIGIGSSSPSGISGLGKTCVNGRSRVPLPPASRTACIGGLPPFGSSDGPVESSVIRRTSARPTLQLDRNPCGATPRL